MRQIYLHGLGQAPASWEKTITQLKSAEYGIRPELAGMIRGGRRLIRSFTPPVQNSFFAARKGYGEKPGIPEVGESVVAETSMDTKRRREQLCVTPSFCGNSSPVTLLMDQGFTGH